MEYDGKHLDWVEKYRPKTLSQITGNSKALVELRTWANSWVEDTPEQKAVILHGRPGIGKTTAAYAIANELNWEIVELNASDQRTAQIIKKIVGCAVRCDTFDNIKRLVILDEADNIHKKIDKGGENAMIEIISKSAQPIILIANDLYKMSSGLRNSCKKIIFYPVMLDLILPVLKNIANIENLSYEKGVLEKLAYSSNGDIRSAINDLQAIAQEKDVLRAQDIIISERDPKEDSFKVLAKIFKGKDIKEARDAALDLDEAPDSFIQWVDENLPYLYTNVYDLNRGYYYISRASTFLARVRRRQDYNMWKFAGTMMTSGIVISRRSNIQENMKFSYPSIRNKIKYTKQERKIRDSISKKIGTYCHVSISYARSTLLPFFRNLMKDEEFASSFISLLWLDSDEIEFMIGDEKRINNGERKNEEISSNSNSDSDIQVPQKEDKSQDKGQSSLFDF